MLLIDTVDSLQANKLAKYSIARQNYRHVDDGALIQPDDPS